MRESLKIIFFGTPLFAAKILSFLIENHMNIVGVVTRPDKPKGRSKRPVFSPVKEWIKEKNLSIPIYQPERASTEEFARLLYSYRPDLFVVVSYGEIIKKNLLDIPRLGSINAHASLLPKYRGASPMQAALLAGEEETGVTIIVMSLKMDAGDVLSQKKISISKEMNFGELEIKLCELASRELVKVIQEFEKGKIKRIPQDHTHATYVSKIDPSMTKIDWHQTAEKIHNQVRAFSPEPGSWCYINIGDRVKRLKILQSHIGENISGFPGQILPRNHNRWMIVCGKGALELLEVQLEGKKRMPAADFFRGIRRDRFLF